MMGWSKFGKILPTFLFIMTTKGLPVGVSCSLSFHEITNFSIPVKIDCCAVSKSVRGVPGSFQHENVQSILCVGLIVE